MKPKEIIVEKLLELQSLQNEVDFVLRSNSVKKICDIQAKAVELNKKYGLPLESKVGMLMAIEL